MFGVTADLRFEVKSGSALVNYKIFGSSPKPDFCAFMSRRLSRSSAMSSAALSLSNRRLYIAQRIRGGLSGNRHRLGRRQASAAVARAPIGSVKLGLSLGGVGKLISVPRPKVTAAERQVQLPHPPVQLRAHELYISVHYYPSSSA
jgi:hypothetical protein